MDDRQAMIDEDYGGDEALRNAVSDEARRDTLRWTDIERCASVLPDLELLVQDLIEKRLGWLPHPKYRLPYEPFLRGLVHGYRNGLIEWEAFTTQVDEQIKLIRNEELGRNTPADYSPVMYRFYDTHLPHQREAARKRVCWLLGYEPALRYSLAAEVWLRDVLAEDSFHLTTEVTPVDIKAMTLIRYREVLLSEGREAANACPLLPVAIAAAVQQ